MGGRRDTTAIWAADLVDVSCRAAAISAGQLSTWPTCRVAVVAERRPGRLTKMNIIWRISARPSSTWRPGRPRRPTALAKAHLSNQFRRQRLVVFLLVAVARFSSSGQQTCLCEKLAVVIKSFPLFNAIEKERDTHKHEASLAAICSHN